MSHAVLVTIFCDGDERDCGNVAESHSLADARRVAANRGWKRDNQGRDFCPTHVSEARASVVGVR